MSRQFTISTHYDKMRSRNVGAIVPKDAVAETVKTAVKRGMTKSAIKAQVDRVAPGTNWDYYSRLFKKKGNKR